MTRFVLQFRLDVVLVISGVAKGMEDDDDDDNDEDILA